MTKRVLVVAGAFWEYEAAFDLLRNDGFEVVRPESGPVISRDALAEALKEVDGAIVGLQPIDAEMLHPDARVRVVVKSGVGLDNIDLVAAEAAGILVGAVPGANAGAVAEYAVGLMLDVGRRISEANAALRGGTWGRFRGDDLTGATVGVIGLGFVGQTVCRLLRGFGVNLLGYDVVTNDAFVGESGITMTSVDDIFKQSDFISLHVPLFDDTRHLVNKERLSLMKSKAIIVNTARGELIDTEALYESLSSGKIRGAGLDVFENEPFKDERFFALNNVVVSPHNAWCSTSGIENTAISAAAKLTSLMSSVS